MPLSLDDLFSRGMIANALLGKGKRVIRVIDFLFLLLSVAAFAETVDVKYRGSVKLDTFECADVNRSSVIRRVCYDQKGPYLPLNLSGTYYHYCEVPSFLVTEPLSARSMGAYYGSSIKGKGEMGPIDCRVKRVPGER